MAKKLNDNQKILAFGGGGLALCLLAGAGIWWAKGLVSDEQEAIKAAGANIAAAETKIAKIPDVEKEVIILRENVDTYVKILPEQGEINNFLRTLNRFVSQSGVEPKSFIDGKPGNNGQFDQYSYRIELRATLWQFMKFINLFENYERFVRVKSFTVRGADSKEAMGALAEGRDVQHAMSLVVETYGYRGGNKNKNVTIPNYQAKREKLREEISFHSLALDRYDYREKPGRRDIFLDPRPRFGVTETNESPESVQRKLLDDYVSQVGEIRELFQIWRDDREQTYVRKAQRERQLKSMLGQVYPKARQIGSQITSQSVERAWNRDVMEVLREINNAIDPSAGQVVEGLRVDEIRDLIDRMRKRLRMDDLEGSKTLFETHEDKLTFEPTDPRYELAQEATVLRHMIERAIEFSSVRLEINGVVVNERGKSGLLVNGQVFEEGDYLDENTLLKTVAKESAEFVFKGYSLVKTW